jgi:hypothetical protein
MFCGGEKEDAPMKSLSFRVLRVGIGGMALLSILAVCTGCWALLLADDCNANVSGTLHTTKDRGSVVEYIFRIDARTHASCAKVDAVLKVWESDGGEELERTVPVRLKVRSGEIKARKVTVRVDKGKKLTRWEFHTNSCQVCGSGS